MPRQFVHPRASGLMSKRNALLKTVMLALGVGAVVVGWTTSRRYLADRLRQHATLSPTFATVTFSEMTSLGNVAIPALLDAAAHPDRQVSRPARRQLDNLLARWEAERTVDHRDRYRQILGGLSDRERSLTPSGRRWAKHTVDRLLELANLAPPPADLRLTELAEGLYVELGRQSQVKDYPLIDARSRPASTSVMQRTPRPLEVIAAAPVEPAETPPGPAAERGPRQPTVTQSEPVLKSTPAASPPPEPAPPARVATQPNAFEPEPDPAPAAPLASGPPSLAWQKPHSAPAEAPAPEGRESIEDPGGVFVPGNATTKARVRGPDDVAAEGRAKAAQQAVADLLKGSESDRLRLVDDLLAGRRPGATELLFELAKDSSPRVRASAISAMCTSSNRQLTEAAWRLALQDEDPRVARLASEIQKLLR